MRSILKEDRRVEDALSLALDISRSIEWKTGINLGFEYLMADSIAIRVGYNGEKDLGGLTFGLGYNFGQYSIDYAFGSTGKLNPVNRIDLKVNFGIFDDYYQPSSQPSSVQPSRYLRRMYWSASGQLVAFMVLGSHCSFLPTRSATVPKRLFSTSLPE